MPANIIRLMYLRMSICLNMSVPSYIIYVYIYIYIYTYTHIYYIYNIYIYILYHCAPAWQPIRLSYIMIFIF